MTTRPQLDTRAWNLAVATTAVLAAACGPSDSYGGWDGSAAGTTGPAMACSVNGDCPEDQPCLESVCTPTERNYGECGAEGGCYGFDCYYHGDCDFGMLCSRPGRGGSCSVFTTEIPECEGPLLTIPLPIATQTPAEIQSLAFMPGLAGTDDLILGTRTGAHVVRETAPSAAIPVVDVGRDVGPASEVHIVAGDLLATGTHYLVSVPDMPDLDARIWEGVGDGAFSLFGGLSLPDDAPAALFTQRGTGPITDLILQTSVGSVYRFLSDVQPWTSVETLDLSVRELVVGDVDGDGLDDLASDPRNGGPIEFLTAQGEYSRGVSLREIGDSAERQDRRLAVGAGIGSTRDEVFSVTSFEGWILFENLTAGGVEGHRLDADPTTSALFISAGPVDDDNFADVVLLEGDHLRVVLGGETGPRCWAWSSLPGPRTLLDVGDFGDQRFSIAVSDGDSVELLQLSFD